MAWPMRTAQDTHSWPRHGWRASNLPKSPNCGNWEHRRDRARQPGAWPHATARPARTGCRGMAHAAYTNHELQTIQTRCGTERAKQDPCTDTARPSCAGRTRHSRPMRTAAPRGPSSPDPRRAGKPSALHNPTQWPQTERHTPLLRLLLPAGGASGSPRGWLFLVTCTRTAQTGAPWKGPSNGRSGGCE